MTQVAQTSIIKWLTRVEQNSPNADRRYENEKINNTTAEGVDHYGKIMGEQPQDDHAVIS